MPLRTPQIPHGLVRAWTPSSAVQVQRRTAFAVARREWPRRKATECEFLILWATGCGKETGEIVTKHLKLIASWKSDTNCFFFFYEFTLIARVEQAAPRGIAWSEQTNPAISDRSTLRYYRFCRSRFASPLSNITSNSFISLSLYLYTYGPTASTLVVITPTYAM